MENLIYEGSNQKKIERFMLGIYTLYNISMILLFVGDEKHSWISFVLLSCLGISWMIHITQFKDYSFRAKCTAIMMQICVAIYAIHSPELYQALPVFFMSVVCLGLYGNAKLIYITVVSAAVIFFCHIVILRSVPIENANDALSLVSRFINILLLEYIVYVWTKRNSEGSKQLIKAIEDLKAVESRKDDFLANVSHEIRTPINTICGMSEIILSEELPYKIKANVQDIQRAGRNLMSVVSDILDFSELQSGNIELEEEAYNITSTINDVINMAMARKNERKVQLIVDCDGNIPSVLSGDEKKLRRIILNLVDNALKFTEEGCVCIGIGYRKETYGINLVVTIKDTGIGMDEESMEHLFTSFNQVDASRKRQEGGVGLGLAISHALVCKMGGAITVKSKLGKGSTVKFVIPQKVLDEAPSVSIADRENINAATYIDMEQFGLAAIRDEYSKTIIHMVEQLKVKCHVCRNLSELQRRQEKEHFTHVFTSIMEYRAGTEYFDELALKTKVIVILDHYDEKYVTNPNLLKIYKPFYILSIASVLNGYRNRADGALPISGDKFITKNAHVLVVDDNRMNIRVIEGMLENYKIKVSIATSGRSALDKISSADYDFVFMDHMMPEMDGVETLRRIRHKVGSYYQNVPVIALTANAVAGTREMLIAEGFNDFLEKPVERSVLERVLRRNLPSEKIILKGAVKAPTSDAEADKTVPKKDEHRKEDVNEMLSISEMPEVQDNLQKPGELEKEMGVTMQDLEQNLSKEGLDVQKGVLYCNGEEQYVRILQGFCEDWQDAGLMASELFEQQNWKDYTITVHGIKSAMRSIGAMLVSDMAKELETAGKEGRIDYIMEHHEKLMEAYNKLFNSLRKNTFICPNEEKEVAEQKDLESELPQLTEEAFDGMLAEMEEAMYSLDGEKLLEMVSELKKYSYHGKALDTVLTAVVRKIEMSDYVSAVEMTGRLKKGMAEKER